jgi:hypothetical protein
MKCESKGCSNETFEVSRELGADICLCDFHRTYLNTNILDVVII